METICIEVAELGMLTFILIKGVGEVSNTAVEHGSLITTSKFAVTLFPSTVAVRTSA